MNSKLLVLLLIILSFRFYFFHQHKIQLADGQALSFETVILSQPQAIGSQQVLFANYKNQRIRITVGRFPEINYGDLVRISSILNIKVLNKNIVYSMYFPKIETINNSSNILQSSLKKVSILRQKLILLFSKTLPSPSSSLLLGILFGVKEQMPKDFSNNLKTSGVFHVIAASGMNVTLVGGFISAFFAFFLKRQIAIGLSILGIIFYAVLAGLEPSIIRASIMGILVFSAQIMGRQSLAINGLALAGFGMLFVDPTLLSDVGFQLSFAATFGILYIRPLPSTIAAQIATLPILLANFGTYSIYSILVNGLVLWTVPILMMIGGLGAILGLILGPLGQLLIYLCYPLLLYFENIVNFFGQIGGVLTIENFPWQFSVGYYCLLAAVLIISKRKI
ncbi:MAG: ComEC/Rec2 family competence protein [Candidatus Levybacteria bacterium]|nr:ComEC/Rec2 family competence protein [Candidatus Levybacteria bacterium]